MQYNYKGKYNVATAYVVKDVVSYQPTINDPVKYYFCLTANTGQVPLVGVDSTYWGIINQLSNFPNSVDTFQNHTNIQASDKTNLARFQTLSLQTSLTQSEADELATLTQTLRNQLFLPDDINALQNSISNLQMFFKDSVDGYINQKQSEFNAKIDKFSDKGVYSSATTYQASNFVTYQEETYICLIDNTVGIPPTDVSKWRKAASKGGKGDTGLTANYKGEYSSASSYVLGDAVSYQGSFYYAKTSVSGISPTDNTKWQLINNLFIGSTAPSAPSVNQAWLDTTSKKIKYWDGFVWIENIAADTEKLGGQLPTYYATAQSVTNTDNKIGLLTNLTTTDKSSLVASNNEIKSSLATHQADDVNHVRYAVATGAVNTYAVTLNPAPTAYVEGMAISVKININSTAASTLNVNGLGAKGIKKANGTDVTNLKANGIYTLRYDSTNFILQGEGGSGNLQPNQALAGFTFTNDNGEQVGLGDADLISSNIRSGINIFGVVGNVIEGKRWAKGIATANSLQLTITGLAFTPKIVIASYYINELVLSLYSDTSYTSRLMKGRTDNSTLVYSDQNHTMTANGFTLITPTNGDFNWVAFE